jgi:hypothetical protein
MLNFVMLTLVMRSVIMLSFVRLTDYMLNVTLQCSYSE